MALSVVSRLAHAGEIPEPEASPAPLIDEPAAGTDALPPMDAARPERPQRLREPDGPRVIWAEPGQAPERPHFDVPVEEPAPRRRRYGLRDVRFVIGLDRASSIAGYRSSVAGEGGSELVTRGVDASIIGDSGAEALTPFVLPRLSLDARLASGLSLGMTFSYAAHSAEERWDGADTEQTLPSRESVLIGPRIGYLRPLSRSVALWLRGGPTWGRRSSTDSTYEPGERLTVIDRQWAISLEPQLLFMPLSHVGFSLGGAFDLGVGGEQEVTYRGGPAPEKYVADATMSTYGISVGLFALF